MTDAPMAWSHGRRATPGTLRLHTQLDDTMPPAWRRLEVASDLSLLDLHDVLQALYGWQDSHLHLFEVVGGPADGCRLHCTAELAHGYDDEPLQPTWTVRLDELLGQEGDTLRYSYDYGDGWRVTVRVEDVVAEALPSGARVTEGAGPQVPEDCGGPYGYTELVAAFDPSHPDHLTSRERLREMWGDAILEQGLVAFGVDDINDRIAALALDVRAPVPATVGDAVGTLLQRAGSPATEHLLLRAAGWADQQADTATLGSAIAEMVRPLTVLLDVIGDGVKLTAAGWLPPTVVSELFDRLDLGEEWIGKGNREDQTYPVLELREGAVRMGLLRKRTGTLLPTAAARTLTEDPGALWEHAARRLVPSRAAPDDFGWQATVVLLCAVAAGSGREEDQVVAEAAHVLDGLGWQTSDGRGVTADVVRATVNELLRLLRRLRVFGPGSRRYTGGPVTAAGAAFAAAALR